MMRSTHRARKGLPILLAAALALVACEPTPTTPSTTTTTKPVPTTTPTKPVTAAGPASGDGTTAATAGASCFGILRAFPSSPSGTYWLSTPAMDRPAPFYCDMVTEGGGWVLIGRGRQGWTWSPAGQGGATAVRSAVSGSAAFAPAALDNATISGLINGASPAALSDGIRVERATNTAGTAKQQVRMFPRFTKWSWKWDGAQLLNRIVISGTSYAGSNTRDTYESVIAGQTTNKLAGQQGLKRLFTWDWAKNDGLMGFSYGRGAPTGSTSATSNLWQRSSSSYSIPFTRVWLRPRLANNLVYPAAPAGGYAAAPKPAGLKDRSELAPWGVTGMNHTNEVTVEPWNTNVLAIESSSTRVYVGGRFTGVKQGPSGATTAQNALAAFDLDGNWISTFRPVIVGRVWDIALTPDNKLIIAGDFESVNGVANTRGLAALDPTTGAVLPGWKARVSRVSGTEWRVRSLDVRGSWIYAAGTFDRVVAGTSTVPVAVTNAMSISTANGTLGTWKPTPNGSVVDIAVTNDSTRVLMAGNFASVGGSATHAYFGITNLSNGTPVSGAAAWKPSDTTRPRYQQAVADLGDRLLVGGSEHNTQLWNKARTTLLDASITKPGGDTQVIEVVGSKAYVGCHCGGWIYHGTNVFPMPPSFRAIDSINLIGVWDTATWTYDTTWFPASLKGASGEGVWAIEPDARGCLWVGGDLNRGAYTGVAATDWLGGFARFCPLDATAPTTPGGFTVASTGLSRKLVWTPATDASGAVTYDVIRNGQVIATVSSATLTYTDATAPAGTRYTVRAVDARGNRSASPAPVTVS
ncbi:MAG TPA: fibrinogen-like YCDxxxxGGGW domain-containing protein [Acidimicrobiales bacterium]|nr:fibrinogen-like YCDxxxxGGGW domain-containing protein [Acidimicrobiales bacterium]